MRFMRTRVLFSSTLTTSLQHNNTNYTPRQGKSGTRHTSPMGGCRSTPPWQRPPGRCCRTFAAPSRPPLAALGGALAGPVAPRCARGLCGVRGRGPTGRFERRPRAASPPGGLAALAPGPLASPPAAASPLAPARPPAPVARGPGAPPGSPLRRLGGRRRAPGRGLAAPPPRCWRAGRAALWSGSRWSPSLRCALPACAPAPPRGPPSGPAAARRLRAARLPSLLPPWGPPRGGGGFAALLAASPRGGLPPAWLRLVGLRWFSGRAPAGAGLAAAPLALKAPPSLPPPGASSKTRTQATPHLRAFAIVRGAPARALQVLKILRGLGRKGPPGDHKCSQRQTL